MEKFNVLGYKTKGKTVMNFTLIVCTYQRAESLIRLLDSVKDQSFYPYEILVVDGSKDDETKEILKKNKYKHLKYYKVKPHQRGLTKQRNIGIELCSENTGVICFLDDDIVLDQSYFENLIQAYNMHPEAVGIGGYITNELKWQKSSEINAKTDLYCFDGFCRAESQRFKLRKKLGLAPDRPPCCLPKFSHGRSVGHLPPSGKTYELEQFMGGVSSYKAAVFKNIKFSTYFEGYGLYEDADFCFRLLKYGKLYVNTSATCQHHHHPSGRPNRFKYGKMVVTNGWYVWRLRWPNPGFKNIIKWHCITLLLACLRFFNIINRKNGIQALTESFGRFVAWIQLIFVKPKIMR